MREQGDLVMAPSRLSACTVVIEPGWPLLTARRKAKASGPRSSPSRMRSGRMRKARPQQVVGVHPRLALVAAHRDQAHRIGLIQPDLRRVLDHHQPLRRVDLLDQRVEQGGLAGRRCRR